VQRSIALVVDLQEPPIDFVGPSQWPIGTSKEILALSAQRSRQV
jgi:hypothetical protein